MTKIYQLSLLVLLVPAGVHAQDIGNAQDSKAISEWVRTESVNQAENLKNRIRDGKPVEKGSVRIYPLSEYPAPESIRRNIAKGIEARKSGTIAVPPDRIPKASAMQFSIGKMRKDEADVRAKLTFPPSSLTQTPLARAELIGAQPSGLGQNEKWSGLSRYYRMQGIGLIEFSEDDYVTAGTRITLVREALNAEVDGIPAIFYSEKSADSRGKVTLSWVTPRRSYRMVLLTDDSNILPQGQKVLIDTAMHLIE